MEKNANSSDTSRMVSNNRQKLKPWLLGILNKNSMEDVAWIDKDEGTFKIYWPHMLKSDWNEDRAKIFEEWATQTGKYVPGRGEKKDFSKWKTNLRCAIHKCQDIKLQKEETKENSYRYYKIDWQQSGVKKVENQKKEEQQSPSGYEISQVKSERVTPEYNLPQSDQKYFPPGAPTQLPAVLEQYEGTTLLNPSETLGSLDQINTADLIQQLSSLSVMDVIEIGGKVESFSDVFEPKNGAHLEQKATNAIMSWGEYCEVNTEPQTLVGPSQIPGESTLLEQKATNAIMGWNTCYDRNTEPHTLVGHSQIPGETHFYCLQNDAINQISLMSLNISTNNDVKLEQNVENPSGINASDTLCQEYYLVQNPILASSQISDEYLEFPVLQSSEMTSLPNSDALALNSGNFWEDLLYENP